MSLQRVKEICTGIGKALSEKIDKDNPDEVAGKLEELTSMISASAYCVAQSEFAYNDKIMTLAEMSEFQGITSTDKKMIFGGRAKEEIYYMTLSERYNKALVHRSDALRSILSYMKSEHQNLGK